MAAESLISKAGVCSMLAALGLSPAGASVAESVGVLGLFGVSDPAAYERALDELVSAAPSGCAVRREGTVSGTRGGLELPEVNRFLLLDCEASVLADAAGRAALGPLFREARDLVLLEGDPRWSAEDAGSPLTERVYVIKLSHFNNRSPEARDSALASIGRDVTTRRNTYVNEAVVAVERAWGIPTPDDVTLLYYRSPPEAKAFRQQNPDLMKRMASSTRRTSTPSST